jgi:hypothetical protein
MLIVIAAVLGAGVGARFHARILSFRDGLARVDLTKAAAPAGFEVSPQTASFIFSSLLHNAWHWGAERYGALLRSSLPFTAGSRQSSSARRVRMSVHKVRR